MILKSAWGFVVLAVIAVACGGSSGTVVGGDAGVRPGGRIVGDASLAPDVFAGTAPGGAGAVGLGGGFGQASAGSCLGLGGSCAANGDCCSGDCTNGLCGYPACTSDGDPCTSNGNCCSQTCSGGKCATLNTTCETLGNTCSASADCCSGLCMGGSCQPSSFCGQAGDACATAADCCTGTCTVASGLTLGTCGVSAPSGPANCGLVDGQLCGGTGTSGSGAAPESGLPACGGPCCSRACAPWGPSGVLVCQPASGCHVVGDLCSVDADCCGSSGLPGGPTMPVTCSIAAGATVGVCRNPMGCKPDGDVCKLKSASCNSSCDCCSGNCETQDTCHQDNVGVPRCAPAQCVQAGGACASSASCCGNAPCVPTGGAAGSPPFACSGTSCIAACGACTNNADCCPGTSCVTQVGTTFGVCGPCGAETGDASTSPPPYDGDASSYGGDAGGSSCALYGQICQSSADCCNGVPCYGGRCESPTPP